MYHDLVEKPKMIHVSGSMRYELALIITALYGHMRPPSRANTFVYFVFRSHSFKIRIHTLHSCSSFFAYHTKIANKILVTSRAM